MTSNFELIDYAKRLKLPLKGVFSKDQLPKRRLGNYILNLQDHDDGNGTHWVCCRIEKELSFYFDSFGFPPPEEVVEWTGKPIAWSEKPIQHRDSVNCGFYCLYVLKCLNNGQSFNDILNEFDENTMQNDTILEKAINNFL
jgi:hypothetical protein